MPRRDRTAQAFFTYGFDGQRITAKRNYRFHRHNEVELDFIESGSLSYLFGGSPIDLHKGQLAVFWGAIPHQVVHFAKGTVVQWFTIPLPWFLQWDLPASLRLPVLQGKMALERDRGRVPADMALFGQWRLDLQGRSEERRKVVLLEMEARLRRMAFGQSGGTTGSRKLTGPEFRLGSALAGRFEQMALYISEHYTEHLTVAEIARAAKLNSDYAVRLFKQTCGLGLGEYRTQLRIAHAQRLLALTDRKLLDIAFASGFGSASQFYALFSKALGMSPRAYRVRLQRTG